MSRYAKYRAKLVKLDGITFQSLKEARRYKDLKILERVGEVSQLKIHPSWKFPIDGKTLTGPSGREIRYVADFSYLEGDRLIVEDCKGYLSKKDPFYRLFAMKWGLMKAIHGVEVRIS